MCGANIRVVTPLFAVCAMPAGWSWARVVSERRRVGEYVAARLMDLCASSAYADPAMNIETTGAFFRALNALTRAEVQAVFNHPVVRTVWAPETRLNLEASYLKFRDDSEVKNE